jgi:phosphate transport system substrate-binding protein
MKFFDWAFKNGDGTAASLEYVTLPQAVKACVLAGIRQSKVRTAT